MTLVVVGCLIKPTNIKSAGSFEEEKNIYIIIFQNALKQFNKNLRAFSEILCLTWELTITQFFGRQNIQNVQIYEFAFTRRVVTISYNLNTYLFLIFVNS